MPIRPAKRIIGAIPEEPAAWYGPIVRIMRQPQRALIDLVALLVVAAAGGVALTWAPDRPVEALAARWAKPPSQFIGLDGLSVHYRDEGPRDDPSPVVLLHGTSSSLHTWKGWVAALKGQHRMITMDLPGVGLTGPTTSGDYSIANAARFTLRLLDTLGVKRFVVGGNSLGGDIAWHVALAAPDRVDRLILVDAAGYDLVPESMPIGFRMARMKSLSWLFERILPRAVVESSLRNVYGDPSRVTPQLIDRFYDLTLREGNRAALGARFAQIRPGADADRIKTLKLPTLILWGARDRLIPPDHARQFQRDIAGSVLVMYDSLGHVPHEEDPARTVADVQRFLAR
jgi:pimeloyl-ACP methyl ester carboxylesterase